MNINHTDTVAENLEKCAKAIDITQTTLKNLYADSTPDPDQERARTIDIYERYLVKLQAQQKRLMSETKELVYEN
jgi:hypothetical protein